MPRSHDNASEPADIAVIGLGPGGLIGAYEAAAKGLSVAAFTNRQSYTRTQLLAITDETAEILLRIKDEADPEDALVTAWIAAGQVRTKDLEEFLYRKLSQQPNVTIIDVSRENNNTIQSISTVDDACYIETQSGDQYFFHHLLEADGARHTTADLVEQGMAVEPAHYQQNKQQERHKYHGAITLELPADIDIPTVAKTGRAELIASMEWEREFAPANYIWPNREQTRFYFAGEIPKAIFDDPDPSSKREKLKQWAGAAIKEQYGIDPTYLQFPAADDPTEQKLQATVFEMNVAYCDNPIIELPNGGKFVRIGDARRSPDYFLGHGMNDAVLGAIAFVNELAEAQFNHSRLRSVFDTMDKKANTRMVGKKLKQTVARKGALSELNLRIDSTRSLLLNEIKQLRALSDDSESDLEAARIIDHCLEAKVVLGTLQKILNSEDDMQPISQIIATLSDTRSLLQTAVDALKADAEHILASHASELESEQGAVLVEELQARADATFSLATQMEMTAKQINRLQTNVMKL
jgi:2-polyprenyl-6-methoxyphenol hydroxylase-like FAD-dependent oxidoreductase/DNA-binding transcriptional MerR regulator